MNSPLESLDRYFCSWSGGKDACLALYRVWLKSGKPYRLLTTIDEDGLRTRGHGVPVPLLHQQAAAMDVPLLTLPTSWDDYEENFRAVLRSLASEGVTAGVFGDIDLVPHREWVERVCESEGMRAILPLWEEERAGLINEFLNSGFRAVICAVDESRLDPSFVGRELEPSLLPELEDAGVDLCGEEGEYHTFVTGGPLLSHEIIMA